MRVPRCDPRTGREPPKSGPSPPPPGRLYRALIKSIKAEPMHHCRATDTIIYIHIMFITMLTTRHKRGMQQRRRGAEARGPTRATHPPAHPSERAAAPLAPTVPGPCAVPPPAAPAAPHPPLPARPRHPDRPSRRAVRWMSRTGGRRARSTERMFMTPPGGAQERQPSPWRETTAPARVGGLARRSLACDQHDYCREKGSAPETKT